MNIENLNKICSYIACYIGFNLFYSRLAFEGTDYYCWLKTWMLFKKCKYCGLGFLPGETGSVSNYNLCQTIWSHIKISFQLF